MIYSHKDQGDDNYENWDDIDTLMTEKFPALSIVTVQWQPNRSWKMTWADCISELIEALPKLHQKGILRIIPPRREGSSSYRT